ncbi:MAG: GumC family protein [Armatimonadota bacterium]
MEFIRIYRALQRRIWIIIASAVLTTSAAAIGSVFLGTYYRATATLMPSERALRRTPYVGGSAANEATGQRRSQINNLIALAKSRYVASQVIRNLKLDATPDKLMEAVSVGPIAEAGGTDLLRVQVEDKNPRDAVRITNEVAKVFVNFYDDLSHRDATRTRQFLEDQVRQARKDLDAKRRAVEAYQRQHRIVSASEEVSVAISAASEKSRERDATAAQLAAVAQELSTLREQLEQTPKTRVVTETTDTTPTAQRWATEVASLEAELLREKAVYTDEHPNVKRIANQLATARQRLAEEAAKTHTSTRVVPNPHYDELVVSIQRLEAQHRGLAAKLTQIQQDLQRRQARLARFSGVDLAVAALIRDYRTAEENYTAVVQRLAQAKADEKVSTDTGAIHIVDLADVAVGPLKRGVDRTQLLILALILGIALGVGFVIGMEAVDTTVRSRQDLEQLIQLPVTGVVPHLPTSPDLGHALPAVTHLRPSSPHAEAYRFLVTDLLLTTAEEPAKAIMVATAKPGQGGTSTICNLAITMAQAGRRVVLIDADMRRPSLHTVFGLPNNIGLSTLLQDSHDVENVLQPTDVDQLYLITAGPPPDNPWQLLRSARMRELIERLKAENDFVFFDTPSAVVFADALAIASLVDGAIFVVRSHEAPTGSEVQIKNLLNKARLRILGVVLNDVPVLNVDSYRFYSHYYGRQDTQDGANGLSTRALPASAPEEAGDDL